MKVVFWVALTFTLATVGLLTFGVLGAYTPLIPSEGANIGAGLAIVGAAFVGFFALVIWAGYCSYLDNPSPLKRKLRIAKYSAIFTECAVVFGLGILFFVIPLSDSQSVLANSISFYLLESIFILATISGYTSIIAWLVHYFAVKDSY